MFWGNVFVKPIVYLLHKVICSRHIKFFLSFLSIYQEYLTEPTNFSISFFTPTIFLGLQLFKQSVHSPMIFSQIKNFNFFLFLRYSSLSDRVTHWKELSRTCRGLQFRQIPPNQSSITHFVFHCKMLIFKGDSTLKYGIEIDTAGKIYYGIIYAENLITTYNYFCCTSHISQKNYCILQCRSSIIVITKYELRKGFPDHQSNVFNSSPLWWTTLLCFEVCN